MQESGFNFHLANYMILCTFIRRLYVHDDTKQQPWMNIELRMKGLLICGSPNAAGANMWNKMGRITFFNNPMEMNTKR